MRVMNVRTAGMALGLLVAQCALTPVFAQSPDRRVVSAAQERNVTRVREALKAGADVNVPQPDGATALAWAAHWDDVELADVLISAGADANKANDLGMTPLMLAAINGSDAMTERLLKAGAKPDTPRPSGETALVLAARAGSVPVVKRLVAAGADVNAKTWQGDTALMFAAAEGHGPVTKLLVEVGADVNLKTEANVRKGRGMAPPEKAEEPRLVNKNQAIAVAQLPKDGDYDPPRPEGGFTALLHAAMSGDLESVTALLDAGVPVDQAAADGSTPLLVAIIKHHPAVALHLLERGANPNVTEPGFTPLHAASITGQMDIVRTLLDKGADVNAGVTMPLRLSAAFVPYNPELVAGRLSQVGATPYMQAAKAVNTEMMKYLVSRGADPKKTATDGTSAIMLAAGLGKRSKTDMFAFIQYYSWDEDRAIETIKLAMANGGDINAKNQFGETALHAAVYHAANKVVTFLVEQGADINAANWADQTPLRSANGHLYSGTFVRYPETAALLRKLGADPAKGTQLNFGIVAYETDKAEPR
jgi:ankyrin repeat protein